MSSPGGSGATNPSTNPFLASPPTHSAAPIVDLFDAPVQEMRASQAAAGKASDDLLQLGNPFADMFSSVPNVPAAAVSNQMWMGNGSGGR